MHLLEVFVSIYILSTIWNASSIPLSSTIYIVDMVDVPIYTILLNRIPWSYSIGAITATLI
jgi:hypothetical protein